MTSMKGLFALLVLAVFSMGVGIGSLIALYSPVDATVETYSTTSRALTFNSVLSEPVVDSVPLKATTQQPSLDGPVERTSPRDRIPESDIEMRADGVFIHINDPQWAVLADTNSMDPLFDIESHLIQKLVSSPDEIQVGDIVSYNAPMGFSIVHRVIEIGNDEEGWYAILKGDNNPTPDPWKVRFDMVRRVTVGIIY